MAHELLVAGWRRQPSDYQEFTHARPRRARHPYSSDQPESKIRVPRCPLRCVAFTIDQQPYLSIDSLWLYHKNKTVIGAQQSVPNGPVVIDQANIGDILDGVKAGLR